MSTYNLILYSITGKLVANMLTERENDFMFNIPYVSNRTNKYVFRPAVRTGSKFIARKQVDNITIRCPRSGLKSTQLLPSYRYAQSQHQSTTLNYPAQIIRR